MKKIKLKSISVRNFKGIRELSFDVNSADAIISGMNGSGKTSVYDAYLWCLFGKTSGLNAQVQVLDANNEVTHKIETSVKVVLVIDDSYEVELERKLVEKWRAQGTPEERFCGTEIQRYYNGVPLSMREYAVKLNSLCEVAVWMLLTNVGNFMELKTEDRRRMLLELTDKIDEDAILSELPAVRNALKTEKKNIEELGRQTKTTRERADKELAGIPLAIAAQDELKVTEDFDALRNAKDKVEAELSEISRALEADVSDINHSQELLRAINEKESKLTQYVTEWSAAKRRKLQSLEIEKRTYERELLEVKKELDSELMSVSQINAKVQTAEGIVSSKINEWHLVNNEVFKEVEYDCCPECHRPYTEEMKAEKRNTAVQEFNLRKSSRLDGIVAEVKELKEQILTQRGILNEKEQVTIEMLKQKRDRLQAQAEGAEKRIEACEQGGYENEAGYKELRAEIDAMKQKASESIVSSEKEELRNKQKDLTAARDGILARLAAEQTNKKIDEKKDWLNKRTSELAQIIADCDRTLYEIQKYKEARINAIEDEVNSHFELVKWKFFERNITNDGKREICVCLKDGVDYNNLNTASKIAVGIDIINAFSKRYDVSVPFFVDNRESVTNLPRSMSQSISLKVEENKEHLSLTILSNN